MEMEYLEYERELERLYRWNCKYGSGDCIEICGLPGAGLGMFVNSFLQKYKTSLKVQKKICCCYIRCPKDHPKNLFVSVIGELDTAFHESLHNRELMQDQYEKLQTLSQDRRKIERIGREEKVLYKDIEAVALHVFRICRELSREINVRLFITHFDNVKELFAQDVNYAMLFKLMCENKDWLGVNITSHRTLAVVTLAVRAFSDFACLFKKISLIGFHQNQMEQIYGQIESKFHFTADGRIRERIQYYCGNNPQRLSILYEALCDLQSDLGCEKWYRLSEEELVDQAYSFCSRQMEEHKIRIIRIIKDMDGIEVLREMFQNPLSGGFNSIRENFFRMNLFLMTEKGSDRTAVLSIPVLEQELEKSYDLYTEKKPKAYHGDKEFIFVSYSHDNSAEVLKIIADLQKRGIRIWYDEGIEPGEEWDDFIAAHISQCSYFISFISAAYAASDNCKDEIEYARKHNKQRLLIYLENISLPEGMQMSCGRLQAIRRDHFADYKEFLEKIASVSEIQRLCDVRKPEQICERDRYLS